MPESNNGKQTTHITKRAEELRSAGRAELINLESFTKALNRKPAVTKTNKFQNNVFARSVGFVYSDHYGASPDRLIGELGGIEIKSPLTKH